MFSHLNNGHWLCYPVLVQDHIAAVVRVITGVTEIVELCIYISLYKFFTKKVAYIFINDMIALILLVTVNVLYGMWILTCWYANQY